jgi:hypothetical protein
MTTAVPFARKAAHTDIERIMAIRHGVLENRLSDPTAVTAADCAAFIDRAEIWVGSVSVHARRNSGDGSVRA